MSKEIGDRGEDLAVIFLMTNGYEILDRNFRSRFGEIDIVAKKDNAIVFVEVKLRKDEGFGTAIEMVTKSKIKKILKTANKYLYENELLSNDWRVDVIAIDSVTGDIDLIENIFIEGMN